MFVWKEGVPRSEYKELPSKNIDTGMGVERMACIIQETDTNYETDLFMPIMHGIEELAQIPYLGQTEPALKENINKNGHKLLFKISKLKL